MPAWALTWQRRLGLLWNDRGIRRRVRRLMVAGTGWAVTRALGRVCIHLPHALGDTCHEATVLMGGVARAFVWALGAG